MSRRLALALILALTAPGFLHAQSSNGEVVSDSSRLRIRAARRDTIRATTTVTAPFTVTNTSDDTASVMPHVEVPKDWTILMGGNALPVAGRSTEMLMLGIVVPARAAAGVFPVRVWITTSRDTKGVMDSVVVRVPERRELEINMLDRPGFVVSGRDYKASFQLRNRGNAPAQVNLSMRGSLSSVTLRDTAITLAPEESQIIHVTARTRAGLQSAIDDVLEVTAKQRGADEPTESSVRVTVVPEPTRKIEEFLRIPLRANLRATNGAVAPYEIMGSGLVVDGSRVRADFLLRGKPNDRLSSFGERDEYRLNLTAPHWQARLGDNFYMLSPLTGGSQPGMGAWLSADRGRFSGGGYAQQFRRDPLGGTESGGFLSASLFEGGRMAVNMVTRAGGLMPVNVASATAAITRGIYHGDVELARSGGGSGSGMARTARFGASASRASVDIGHTYADTSFGGVQRGANHNYLTTNLAAFENVSFAVNGSRHEADMSRATGVPYIDNLDVGLLSTTLYDQITLELNGLRHTTTIAGVASSGSQRGVRARGDLETPVASLSLEAEVGRSTDASLAKTQYSDARVSARRAFGPNSLSLWTGRYSGGSITKGPIGSLTIGGDATWRLGLNTNLSLLGFATRQDATAQEWHSQAEVLATRSLPNGASLTFRARVIGGEARPDQTVAFLEYGMPLRLPVSRLRSTGRVRGRVVDAVTGSGVPGALVRLGPQIAITDSHGDVAFGGVPGGEHRLSMSQETSFADAVFVGDPTLLVDSMRTRPTEFRLAIARSARVNISARRYVARQTTIAPATRDSATGAPRDSLVDAGPLANATLVLIGERDTLYRTTNDNGTATFTDVPPGTWVLTIRGDAPAYTRFDPDRLELVLKPGETQTQAFRLIPRRREVQIIGESQELKSTTAESKSQNPGAAVKTVKPEEKKNERQDR